MNLTGNEPHDIDLAEAAEWTASYRATIPAEGTIAHYLGKKAIQEIFDQEDCVGMRIYYALDTLGQKQLIITGVTKDGNDLYLGKLAERSIKCPPICSLSNPLNS